MDDTIALDERDRARRGTQTPQMLLGDGRKLVEQGLLERGAERSGFDVVVQDLDLVAPAGEHVLARPQNGAHLALA